MKLSVINRLSNKLLLIVLLFGIFWQAFVFWNFPRQAFMEALSQNWYMSQGLVFYKDFIDTYFPILRIILLPIHQIFGFSQTTTILLAPINSLLVFFLIFVASLKLLKSIYRVVPPTFFAFWDPFLSENHFTANSFLGLTIFLTFIFWWIWYLKNSKKLAFFVGLLAGISFFTSQVVFLFVGTIFLSFIYKTLQNRKYLGSLLASLAGFLAPTVFILFWFIHQGAIKELFQWTIIYYLGKYHYASLGRSLQDINIFIAVHSPIILACLGAFLALKKVSPKGNELKKKFSRFLFVVLLLFSLTATFWFANFHPSRFQISLPLFAFVFGLGLQESFSRRYFDFSFVRLIGIIFIIAMTVLVERRSLIPRYERNIIHPTERQVISELYEDDPMYEAVLWIKDNSSPEARIYVFGDPSFYFHSQRLPAIATGTTHISIIFDWSEFIKTLKQSSLDYWVVDERVWARARDFGFGENADKFRRFLNCQEIAINFDFWTIRKHLGVDESCIQAI